MTELAKYSSLLITLGISAWFLWRLRPRIDEVHLIMNDERRRMLIQAERETQRMMERGEELS